MDEPKVIIVSNRLPLRVQIKKEDWKLVDSEGGLATGLGSIYQTGNNIWIGWPGTVINNEEVKEQVTEEFKSQKLMPVWLNQTEIKSFYEGFSNETLWPLFHYFLSFAKFNPYDWEAYKEVNQKFADVVLSYANAHDTIWIHDYQLMLVPAMIRKERPDVSIGFFQHIPFPSYELFRMLPWRKELLTGLLGADLIGFHTFDDERHFLSSVTRILNLPSKGNEVTLEERTLMVDAFPMGIDYEKYHQMASNPKTKIIEEQISQMVGDKKLMLSIDRLDYSKGIVHRLHAYKRFLKNYPEFKEQIVFLQLIVPSRDKVKQYAQLKEEINCLVSEINAQFGTLTWQPIYYFYRSYPIEMVSALYSSADIALVAPLRDGMNLVCKEYIASKIDKNGVLILSEMAGASKELNDAILINPQDQDQVAAAIYEALSMPLDEKVKRMESMQMTIQKFNIHHWVKNFMERLNEVKSKQQSLSVKLLRKPIQTQVQEHFFESKKRLLFLDYDGTLVPFQNDPLNAAPDKELMDLLYYLYKNSKNKVVLISGRKMDILEKWFGNESIDLIAEHGVWMKKSEQEWKCSEHLNNDWKEVLLPILKKYEMLTPGSFVEEKSYSLAWHYRKVETGLGERRAQEIIERLKSIIPGLELQILEGHKVIEIKSIFISKGKAAMEVIQSYKPDFIIAIGDDVTDEDTFRAMPDYALTVKVGSGPSEASFYVKNVNDVRGFLNRLAHFKPVLEK